MVVYIDTSSYFCEHQTGDVIGAQALEGAGPREGVVAVPKRFTEYATEREGLW